MWKHHLLGFSLCAIVFTFAVSSITPTIAHAQEYSWGFTKAKDGKLPDAGSFEAILNKHDSLYIGNTNEKVIYLTFDNGFEAGYTEGILDTLKEENVPATFFLVGHYLTSASDLVKRMVEDGLIKQVGSGKNTKYIKA